MLLKFTRDGRDYVLRRPPPHPGPNSNDTMRNEARVLAAIADTDVPHPRLIAASPEEDVLGVAFYLMEPIDGFNPTVGLPALHAGDPDIRFQMSLSLIDSLAALGRVDYKAVGLGDLGRAEGFMERQVGRWLSHFNSYKDFDGWTADPGYDCIARIADWLERNLPTTHKPGIMHGDYHFANVMVRYDGPEIAAIVDWELTTIGDPLIDLGWAMSTWPDASIPDGQ